MGDAGSPIERTTDAWSWDWSKWITLKDGIDLSVQQSWWSINRFFFVEYWRSPCFPAAFGLRER